MCRRGAAEVTPESAIGVVQIALRCVLLLDLSPFAEFRGGDPKKIILGVMINRERSGGKQRLNTGDPSYLIVWASFRRLDPFSSAHLGGQLAWRAKCQNREPWTWDLDGDPTWAPPSGPTGLPWRRGALRLCWCHVSLPAQ